MDSSNSLTLKQCPTPYAHKPSLSLILVTPSAPRSRYHSLDSPNSRQTLRTTKKWIEGRNEERKSKKKENEKEAFHRSHRRHMELLGCTPILHKEALSKPKEA